MPSRDHNGGGRAVDADFLALPLRTLADAALARAAELGCEYAAFRAERVRSQDLTLRDARLEGSRDGEVLGFGVRVIKDGSQGFAATIDLTPEAAAHTAEQAVDVARVAAAMTLERVELADEPVHSDVTWVSDYRIDPFGVDTADKVDLLAQRSRALLDADGVDHSEASLLQVKEQKFYADSAGTVTTQQRVRLFCELEAFAIDPTSGRFDSMKTLAQPSGRGYEYVVDDGIWDWSSELAAVPGYLREKLAAPSVEPGQYDLVIDPTNLWLTIHESIGHATELDRALGYEANMAGTSFATPDQLGSLTYGSPVMTVTGDRTAEHGLATIGYDDEGVQTRSWNLIENGTLVGYQMDRPIAHRFGHERSNGCAFADAPHHVPIQRMANVSLQPAPDGPSTDDLIGGVDNGVFIAGRGSWSIDMQRYNFQFTGQRFFKIQNGRLAGQLRDVAYQATTTDFWGSMEAVGGPQTYVLGGTFMCGKAQPGQTSPASHGAPSALFRNVRILNTSTESGR